LTACGDSRAIAGVDLLPSRVGRFGALALGTLLCAIAALLLAESPHQNLGVAAGFGVVGLIFVAVAVVAFAWRPPPTPAQYRHVLRTDLHLSLLTELRGVQYTAFPFPDRGPAGDDLALAIFVQNVFTTHRTFRVVVRRTGVVACDPGTGTVSLGGGECGLLLVRGRTKPQTEPGEYTVTIQPRVDLPQARGARLFPRPETAWHAFGTGQVLLHTVTAADTSSAPPLPPAGYSVLFRPGMPAPDTGALAFLNVSLEQ
jgi:hypothetical protein